MKAIILAAGIGSRLRPITDKIPKGMVKVCGIPIIEHQICAYLTSGILEKDIIIVSGYKSSIIEKFVSKKYPSIKIIVNEKYAETNNMYSLAMAFNHMKNSMDNIVISNGDCVYDLCLVDSLISEERMDLVACDVGSYIEESMKVQVDKEGKIIDISKSISEKAKYGVSIDLYKLSIEAAFKLKSIIVEFLKNNKTSWTEIALQILFKENRFEPFDIENEKWYEIDNNNDLIEAEKLFSNFDVGKKQALVLDLDGTVYLGNSPILPTIDFINRFSSHFDVYYITNNTSMGRCDVQRKLEKCGLCEVDRDKIITPIGGLVKYICEVGAENIYCLGTDDFKNDLKKFETFHVDENCAKDQIDTVVLSYDKELTYSKLAEVCTLLHNPNVAYLATHADVVCPTENGPIPDIGSFVELIFMVTGRRPEKYFGKPDPNILEGILQKYSRDKVLFVGDRLYTDKALSDNCNIEFCLVLSGETGLADLQEVEEWPSVVLENLGQMQVIDGLLQ